MRHTNDEDRMSCLTAVIAGWVALNLAALTMFIRIGPGRPVSLNMVPKMKISGAGRGPQRQQYSNGCGLYREYDQEIDARERKLQMLGRRRWFN
jgi:hypothetical protein